MGTKKATQDVQAAGLFPRNTPRTQVCGCGAQLIPGLAGKECSVNKIYCSGKPAGSLVPKLEIGTGQGYVPVGK